MNFAGRWTTAFLFALTVLSTGCSLLAPKPQVVYHRPELQNRKIVIMPVTDFEGNRTEGAKSVEALAMKNWAGVFGRKNVIPGGPAVEQINKATGAKYVEFLKSLDEMSTQEQQGQSSMLREYVKAVSAKTGNYNLAFTIVEGGPDQYKAGEVVRIHLGIFDTKALTWKWITKLEDKKGMFGDWKAASLAMLSNSFDVAKKVNKSKTSMAEAGDRMPASEE